MTGFQKTHGLVAENPVPSVSPMAFVLLGSVAVIKAPAELSRFSYVVLADVAGLVRLVLRFLNVPPLSVAAPVMLKVLVPSTVSATESIVKFSADMGLLTCRVVAFAPKSTSPVTFVAAVIVVVPDRLNSRFVKLPLRFAPVCLEGRAGLEIINPSAVVDPR